MSRQWIAGLAGVGLMLVASAAWAQQIPQTPPAGQDETGPAATGLKLTVGLGAGLAPDYEGSDHYKAVPLWNIRAQNLYAPTTYAQILGPTLRSNLLPSPHWRLGIAGRYISKRSDVEDNKVDDMKNVDASVMLGGMLGYDFIAKPGQVAGIEAVVYQDVASGNGALATLRFHSTYAYTPHWVFGFSASTSYASADYMDAYFSVGKGDSNRSGLKQYSTDAGFEDVGGALSVGYNFATHWNLTAIGSYKRLVGDAADSPVTKQGSENQWFTGLLLNYRF